MTVARTPPWSWYEDPEIARRERDRIFRRAWQYAGRREELTAPGSFAADARRRASRSCSRATATTCCARSPTSAATAARSSRTARASAARCSARTTRGPTGSTAACARAPRTRDDPSFDATGLGLVPMAGRHPGSVRLRQPGPRRACRSRRRSATSPEVVARARPGRRRAPIPPPGRVRDPRELEDRAWRTTSSATTASSTIPGWCW